MTTALAPTILDITGPSLASLSKERKEPAWLSQLRLKALENYAALPWPGPRDEKWKRTQLDTIPWKTLRGSVLPEKGEGWVSLETALAKNPEAIRQAWEAAVEGAKTNKFLSLTLALAFGGSCLFVEKGARLKTRLESSVCRDGFSAHFSVRFVFVEEGAEVQLWEELNGTTAFVSTFTSIHIKDNAQLSLYHLQNWDDQTVHFQFQDIRQEAHSKLSAIEVAVGGRIFRNETSLNLQGRGAENKVLGVLFGESKQNFENWIVQHHTAPQTTSDIQYRGALKGESHSFFSGMVYIGKEAQQSDAYQGSKSLLLSQGAKADAIPNLEILADDVKCSHGAAVGSVDEDQKYYLQTRGVTPEMAEEIIVEGFFEPVISEVPSEPMQEKLRNFVEEKLHR